MILLGFESANKNNRAMRGKQKKKQPKQSKKRQLLTVFRQTVPLLQLLTPEDTDALEEALHIFVFTRGQCLAKEGEVVDYVGSIAEGRAVGKGKPYELGDLIGHATVLGYQQRHPRTITAESDGVIIALRIVDLLAFDKHSLKNRILTFMVEIHAQQISSREVLGKSFEQFETVEEKKIAKYLTAEWSSFLSGEMDGKEKAKFSAYFPFYRIKQKDLLSNQTLKPALIYIVQGQLIAKSKQEQRILQSGTVFNLDGFLFGHPSPDNLYCLSTEATVLLVDRTLLESSFKFQTHRALMKLALGQLSTLHMKQVSEGEKEQGREGKSWSMFKKYPNAEILPLPKKTDNTKTASKPPNTQNQTAGLSVFQTLFRQQLGSSKEKTSASMAESGYDKLYTLKTESAGKEVQAVLQLQKLRKEVELLSEKLRFSEEMGKLSKLELIENRARVSMGPVFKQIRRLHQQDDSIRSGSQKEDVKGGENALTLKEALARQYKDSKVQMLVAKCAFRWLYLTRKRRATRGPD